MKRIFVELEIGGFEMTTDAQAVALLNREFEQCAEDVQIVRLLSENDLRELMSNDAYAVYSFVRL